MKYRIEEYKLKNGIEDISIIFDEKYQLLTTFMSCDVLPFEKWIKSGFDRVLSGKSEYEEVNGNVCCAEISPKTTKVYYIWQRMLWGIGVKLIQKNFVN